MAKNGQGWQTGQANQNFPGRSFRNNEQGRGKNKQLLSAEQQPQGKGRRLDKPDKSKAGLQFQCGYEGFAEFSAASLRHAG